MDDYWTEDFVVERQPLPAAIRHAHAEFVVPSLTAGPTRKPSPPETRPRGSIPRFSRHQNSTETAPRSHAFTPSFAYSPFVMRGAFVVQLGSETRPAEVGFEGWDEEDDSYTEQQLVCGFGAGQPIATRETSFVLQRCATFAELSNKVKKGTKTLP